MISNSNHKHTVSGDDPLQSRLLSFFQANIEEPIKKISLIRDQIFKIETHQKKYAGKGFSNADSLKKQKWLTKRLHKAGFNKTYHFLKTKPEKGYLYKGKYYGILTWIEHSNPVFRFNSNENCQAGVLLLKEFHDHTKKVLSKGDSYFGSIDYYQKWVERYRQFKSNVPALQSFVPSGIIEDILKWGEKSLKNIEYRSPYEKEERVILHGDVAHHNFIRSEKGLYLIDFDLSSIGHPIHDYLQYANRILPFLQWDVNELIKLPGYSQLLEDPYFIYAILYPTDIYREWNRAIKHGLLGQEKTVKNLLNVTIDQYEKRLKFFNSLQNMVI